MYGETTPSTNDEFGDLEELTEDPIKWSDYTENNHVEVQELLDTFVQDYLVIQKYIRRDYDGYLDYVFTSEESIDGGVVDADLEENDIIETDEYDQSGDTVYYCTECDKQFDFASSFMEHAIVYIYQDNKVDEMTQDVIRPSQFLSLLCDYIWNKEEGKSYQEYMEQYIRSRPNRLHDFFNYMVQQGTIPQGLWDKYNEILFIDSEQ